MVKCSLAKTLVRKLGMGRGKAHRYLASIALLGILLLGAAIMVGQATREPQSMAKVYTHAQVVLRASHDLKIAMRDVRRQERSILLTGDGADLGGYLERHDALVRSVERLSAAAKGAEDSDDAVDGLRTAASGYLKRVAAAVALARGGEKVRAIATLRRAGEDDALSAIDENVDGIVEGASGRSRSASTRSHRVTDERSRLVYVMLAGGLALLLLAMLSALALRRSRERIDGGGEFGKCADTDDLTGVANRRKLLAVLDLRIAEARTNGTPLSFAMFDIDNFKSINETYGHAVGDRTIRHVVRTALRMVRLNDLIGRLGDDEFGMILPKAEQNSAFVVCERLRKRLREEGVPVAGEKPLYMTISSGIACLTDEDEAGSLIKRAERALYIAKRDGRNQVRLAA